MPKLDLLHLTIELRSVAYISINISRSGNEQLYIVTLCKSIHVLVAFNLYEATHGYVCTSVYKMG